MATVALGNCYASVIMAEDDVDGGIAPSATSATPLSTKTVTEMIEKIMNRAFLTQTRVPQAVDRILQPNNRYSQEELSWHFDAATVEIMMRVKSAFLRLNKVTRAPSGGAWTFNDVLRVLGSTVSVDSNIAKRIAVSMYNDITGRGGEFSDSDPVYILSSGEFTVFGDSQDPTDAAATFIQLPSKTTYTSSGTFNGTTGITLDGNDSTFLEARDCYIPVFVTDGVDSAYGYIVSVGSTTTATLSFVQSVSAIDTGADAVTVTWIPPLSYSLPEILLSPLVELVASNMFAEMGNTALMNQSFENYTRLMKGIENQFIRI